MSADRPVCFDDIAAELKAIPAWGLWKRISDSRSGKDKKIPFRAADGAPAHSGRQDDWTDFETARAKLASGDYAGLGFAFFCQYNLVGIDRDDVYDPATRGLQPWAAQELVRLQTYTEVSPSGTGYKQIGYGRLPDGAKATKAGSQTEIYDGAPGRERYFTITGIRFPHTPDRVLDIGTAVLEAHQRMMRFDLLEAFERRRLIRKKDGNKRIVQCPWHAEHRHGDDEAALFTVRGRRGGFGFKCLHSHCEHRSVADVYEFFGFSEDRSTDPRPSVLVGGDLHLKTQEVIDVLVGVNEADTDPAIYLFGNSFGRIGRMTTDERPQVDLLTPDKLRALLASRIRFQDFSSNGVFSAAHPPQAVITNMLAADEAPPFPRIRRLVTAPVFAADGSLLTTPGFHPTARVFYAPDPGFGLRAVSNEPSAAEVAEARHLLTEELLGDFLFRDPRSDRAHAVGLLLLFFVRDLIDGNLPLHLIEKPEVGSGAGKLADVCMIPALGGRQGVLTDCDDEDEWRKRITAVLLDAPEAVLLDNVEKIASHHLAALFTTKTWKDRVLGATRLVDLPADMPWVATSNNPLIGYDLVRRICPICLDPRMPEPSSRTGFRHELPAWAIANRALLVWAALTLIANWIAGGRRPWSGSPVASFEQWSVVIGGVLEAGGIEGFGDNVEAFRRTRNLRGNAWRDLVAHWWDTERSEEFGSGILFEKVVFFGLEGELGLHEGRVRDPRVAFGLKLRQQVGRQFRLSADLVVMIETPEGATTRAPYRIVQVHPDGTKEVVEPPGAPQAPAPKGTGMLWDEPRGPDTKIDF